MKIPNYFKLYFHLFIQAFQFKAYLVLTIAPFILGAIFKGGSRNYITEGLGNMLSFYQSLADILFEITKKFFDLSLGEFFIGYAFLIGLFNYMIMVFFFFIIIEICYFKYRIKGHTTKEIKEIILRKKVLKEIEKEKDRY